MKLMRCYSKEDSTLKVSKITVSVNINSTEFETAVVFF